MTTHKIDKVRYKNRYYGVMCVDYKDTEIPVLLDWDDSQTIRRVNKNWKCNQHGSISCSHTCDKKTKEVFIHELIMSLKTKEKGKRKNANILHINNIALDNRRENLMYNDTEKPTNINSKKKVRSITLPEGIDPDTLPTYVWYMKPNGLHGDRFIVKVGDVTWKTTSSNKKNLRYKLEEAKLFLRQLKQSKPELFEEHSMNGDYTRDGEELARSYYTIVKRAGYDHLNDYMTRNNTEKVLKQGALPKANKELLARQGDLTLKGGQRRRCVSNLPENCGILPSDIPKYCYFKPEYEGRGEHFVVIKHPNMPHGTNIWQTTTARNVSIIDKYNEMIDYIKTIQ